MYWLKFAISCYFVIVLQTGFLAIFFPDNFRPFLPVILANVILLSWPTERALIGVWIIGLLVDLTSIVSPGVIAFCLGVYALIILLIKPILFLESPFAHVFIAVLGVFVIYICYNLIRIFSHIPPLPINIVGIIGQALSTGIVAGIIGRLIRKRFMPKRRTLFV